MNGREEKVRNNPYESGSGKENSGIMLEAMLAEGTLVKESHQGVSSVGSYTSCPECDATLDGTKTSFEKHFVDHHKEVGYVDIHFSECVCSYQIFALHLSFYWLTFVAG